MTLEEAEKIEQLNNVLGPMVGRAQDIEPTLTLVCRVGMRIDGRGGLDDLDRPMYEITTINLNLN